MFINNTSFSLSSSPISQPLHWRRSEISRVSVHISSPFHFYLYIKLFSSGGNQIALPATSLSLSFRVPPTYTEYKRGLQHRQLSTCFLYTDAPAVWMTGPSLFLKDLVSYKKRNVHWKSAWVRFAMLAKTTYSSLSCLELMCWTKMHHCIFPHLCKYE